MRTSETGSDACQHRDGESAYTLVETLVTVAMVGLLAGAVVLSAPSPARHAHEAAERLAARLAHAADESVLMNRPVALVTTSKGYGFALLGEEGWSRAEGSSLLGFRAWPEGASYRVEGRGSDLSVRDDERSIVFDPVVGATPARVVLTASGVRFDIDVDGSGQVSVERHD